METAIREKACNSDMWDWVLIDEAQDVTILHEALIKQIRARHWIIAGDPRQELYPGATWFSHLWAEIGPREKIYLRYNHRSRKNIVKLLNWFNDTFFPGLNLLHQIPTREGGGEIHIVGASEIHTEEGFSVAERMSNYSPGDAYAIGPVTIKKFKMREVITALREGLHRKNPEAKIEIFDREEIQSSTTADMDPNAYVIGTSYMFKGTERECVVVLRPNAHYYTGGITKECLLKLLYVAISRAKSDLLIIFQGETQPFPLFNTIPREIVCGRFIPPRVWLMSVPVQSIFGVKEDPASLGAWSHLFTVSEEQTSAPIIDIPVHNDSDFVGCFVEALVAKSLGIQWKSLKISLSTSRSSLQHCKPGIYQLRAGEYYAVLQPWMQWNSQRISKFVSSFNIQPEYNFAQLEFSISAGTQWTVSSRLKSFTPSVLQLAQTTQTIRAILGAQELEYQKIVIMEITPTVLHAAHNGTLLNTRDGRQWFLQVSPSSNAYVNDVARALIALKSSTAAILSIRNNRLVHRPKSPAYVAVDVLVLHDADNEFPVEIGGIVFAPGTNNIYSVFHKTLDGVVEDREEFSGLRILDRSRLATSFTQTITSLHEWIKTVAPLGTLLFWGPTNYDLICVHLSDYECIDIKEYYLYWNANSGSKKGEKQTDDTLIEATWKMNNRLMSTKKWSEISLQTFLRKWRRRFYFVPFRSYGLIREVIGDLLLWVRSRTVRIQEKSTAT
ncbi:hypothetical protein GLOIN_2v1483733 [Rhizophagus irregularis DAOM 181602=DAOM 197198]|uniref:Uncharacterized protein n=1 Tax=Rhizophagus irregularis (strain DAOM 181602 / DAOM 197198 / MUCL 43194) TaxID=747089 RepID=A0A2P4PH32_RHIID|nr:hypothetical protein GLOIN_2v1483733 [Rhizophagus irregularis DAOM 181602=DAOM 197198]POG64680.1 hypothetical protein GLOIN_2v1483733 [Rhizophagus irregularis DAOM 181602=DAOM 197198]|eukprot:XP_025171546.1 hypothetical protein GLOIN_2v1483733 [Rhizophagus irregularis DAOM 181602=DAOM 197198]